MEPFEINIQQYNLLSILELGSNILLKKFNEHKAIDSITVPNGKISLNAWDISDINYYAILNTHEFIDKNCNFENYIYIVNDFLKYDQFLSKNITEAPLELNKQVLLLLWGLSRKEFWYQEQYKINDDFNRQIELLENINDNDELNLDNACMEETGFSIYEYRMLLLTLAGLGSNNHDMSNLQIVNSELSKLPFINNYNLIKVRDLLTTSYNEVRKSKYKEQVFYIYPIIKTLNNKHICLNQYLLYRKIAEGPLWAIRNYYKKHGTKKFLIYYGKLFEKYVSKIFEYYVPKDRYFRIKENNNVKSADWILETPNYHIIIEQKAFIPELMLMDKYPEKEKLIII
jgi:hypothetical protein